MCICTPKDDLCIPIIMEELEKSLQETRRGKASGLDGILPEILKLGGPKLKRSLTFPIQYQLAEANTPTGLYGCSHDNDIQEKRRQKEL